ncbi:MAG: hypothetical protein Q4D61_05870 [Cardiobacteriaceae bacterium]|nr:hypothetical protein [Cardiobacteriaceae bacterium]
MFRKAIPTLSIMATTLLVGCVQFSDTLNRPQANTLPADGGMALNTMADAPPVAAAQTGGVHPNIVYFFEKLCAGQRKIEPETQCRLPDEIDYQDDDVALVSTENVAGLRGSGGYEYILLDLKGRPGGFLYNGFGLEADVKRKGQRLTITIGGRLSGKSKKVINLNGKTRVVDVCEEFGC